MVKNSSFQVYCKSLLKDSTLTGVPQIVQSRNKLRKAFKLAIFLVCVAGLIYQVCEFLILFLKYSTIPEKAFTFPEEFTTPAVTICNENRVSRQKFCTEYRDCCYWNWTTFRKFCNKFPFHCMPERHKPKEFSLGIPKNTQQCMVLKSSNNPKILDYPVQKDVDYVYQGAVQRDGAEYFSVVRMTRGMEKYACVTINSLVRKPNAVLKSSFIIDGYYMYYTLRIQNYMKQLDEARAHFIFHDPRSLANPFNGGVTLYGFYSYELTVSKQISESLPYPYKTDCEDYIGAWEKNGGEGPLTKQDCIEVCKINEMLKKENCVQPSITYPHDHEICQVFKKSAQNLHTDCSKICKEACRSESYTTQATILSVDADYCGNDSYCKNQAIISNVQFNEEVQTIKQKPKFEDIELFSYIGGYMGLWMGISLVSFIDFLETLWNISAYPVMKMKKTRLANSTPAAVK